MKSDSVLEEKITTIENYTKKNINNLTEKLNKEIDDRTAADNAINQSINTINGDITNIKTNQANMQSSLTNLTTRVAALESKITISPNAPSALADGKVWLQYF